MKTTFGDLTVHNPLKDSNLCSALIAEGGAIRTIYSVGILDSFIQANYYPFEYHLGVSAGSANMAAYLGKQYGRNYQVFTDYCLRQEFKSIQRFLTGGDLVDINWLWAILEEELPLFKDRIAEYSNRFEVVATHAHTGKAEYISPIINDEKNELLDALKCSGNMPFACKDKILFRGQEWFDGGVADSIPVQRAYELGARRIVILRSQPAEYQKPPSKVLKVFQGFNKEYPKIASALATRHEEYNSTLEFIRNPPADCEIVEISPPVTIGLGQFTTHLEKLDNAYAKGVTMGSRALNFLT